MSRLLVLAALILQSCLHQADVKNIKDLDENMLDLRAYQENWGDHVDAGTLKDGEWLLIGMDSILKIVSSKFKEHRKLSEPFSYFYKKDLKPPIRKMMKAVELNDTSLAKKNYRILVKKCNGCHIEHDIEKVVRY